MKDIFDMFWTFFKMGALTFGGGYAMLPILQREVVEKKKWATEAELMDYYAVGQCTPGVIAVNTATFIGRKKSGVLGAIVTTAGVVMPSCIIITLIAALITGYADNIYVKSAFAGIRVCVCVLIFNAVLKLGKKSIVDALTAGVFLVVWGISLFLKISPVLLVAGSAICGIVAQSVRRKKK